jgi:hypothetical protein
MEVDSKHGAYLWQPKLPLYDRHWFHPFQTSLLVLFDSVDFITICIKIQKTCPRREKLEWFR